MNRIEMDIWEPTPENPQRVKRVGQRTAQEVFEELKHRLESTGHLPDEYFLLDHEWGNGKEIPEDAGIFCTTDYGANEGIYLDIYLKWYDKQQEKHITAEFATGKTLGETESDLDRMYLTASTVTKAFHSDGVHARYIRLGEPEKSDGCVMHLNGAERRLLIDSLVDKHSRLIDETQAVEQLLRRVTGSITEYINEAGQHPLQLSDFDAAVLAIQEGNLAAFNDTYKNTPDKTGELLEHAAGRPGNVGKKMTIILLAEAKDIPNEMYLNACKKAIDTGDAGRTLLMAQQADACVAGLDMSLYGKMMSHALNEHMSHIANSLLDQYSPEQVKAADPSLLPQAIYNRNYQMAMKLAEKGIDGNKCAAELIHSLISHGNDRGYFKILMDRGMQVNNANYSAMQACVRTESIESAKLLLDRGMDFDLYSEWAAKDMYTVKDGDTFTIVKEYWENEIKQANDEITPEDQSGQTMGGM